MSAAMENLRSDVHKPPEQLEREADSARTAVEGTLAELEQRLSPGQMVDRVMDMVKRHGGEFGDNLLTQVRNNPLPTIIVGVGVAWLMAASKRPPPRGYPMSGGGYGYGRYDGDEDIDATERWSSATAAANGNGSSGQTMRDRAASMTESMASAGESAKHAAEDALDATTDAAHRAADATARAAHRAAEATRHAADRVAYASRTSMRSLTESYDYLCREQPFVLGAIAVAAGAALGAMVRTTPTENSLLGKAGDAARSRLKSEAEARTGELRAAAENAVESAVDSVRDTLGNRSGGTGDRDGTQTDATADTPRGDETEQTPRGSTSRPGGIESGAPPL